MVQRLKNDVCCLVEACFFLGGEWIREWLKMVDHGLLNGWEWLVMPMLNAGCNAKKWPRKCLRRMITVKIMTIEWWLQHTCRSMLVLWFAAVDDAWRCWANWSMVIIGSSHTSPVACPHWWTLSVDVFMRWFALVRNRGWSTIDNNQQQE